MSSSNSVDAFFYRLPFIKGALVGWYVAVDFIDPVNVVIVV